MRWSDLCREIQETMVRELDLRYEASSLQQLQRTLPRHGIYVPEVFSEYCTARVLVMEYIHGALIADYLDLCRSDPQRLARWLEEEKIVAPEYRLEGIESVAQAFCDLFAGRNFGKTIVAL